MKNEKDAFTRFKEKIRKFELLEKEYHQKHRDNDALIDSIFRMTYFIKMLEDETLTDVEREYFNKQKDVIMEETYTELKKPMYPLLSVKPDEGKELERISSILEEKWGNFAEEFFNKYPDLKKTRLELKTKKRSRALSENTKEIVSNVVSKVIVAFLYLVCGIVGIGLALVLIYFLVFIGFF